ncbi:hypothetical protein [Planctellipticum variicoloris]|uniref:hypothetical protein n=1 Tax=Planctellipticum variicoloris TaxID=3064265 RepID=UPI002CF91253|nr:hypothetical protein SH412_004482 [Planctomycetaceae bacterium SH412]HTN02525.1 hypothetical protein [Planctomycetaceae bacterium]
MLRTLVLGTAVAVGLVLAGQGTAQAGGPGYHGGHHHHHHHGGPGYGGGYGYRGGYVGRPIGYRPVFVGNSGPAFGYPVNYGYGYGQPACGTGYGGYGYGASSYGYGSGVGIVTPGFGFYYSR